MRFASSKSFLVSAITCALMIVSPSFVAAEVRSFHGTGAYTMSAFETINVAEQHALEAAEQNAIEQAGVYVSSFTKTENLKVTKDEVTVLTNGILRVTSKTFKKSMTGDGEIRIEANIDATIDTDEIEKNLKDKQQLDMMTLQYNELQRVNKEQAEEIKRLKEQVASKNPPSKEEIQRKETELNNRYLSHRKMQEAMQIKDARENKVDGLKKYDLYTEAIRLDPNNTWAYYLRAFLGVLLNRNENIVSDTTYVIDTKFENDPTVQAMRKVLDDGEIQRMVLDASRLRMIGYSRDDQAQHVLNDYAVLQNAHVSLSSYEHYLVGMAYTHPDTEDFTKALDELNLSIELNDHYAEAYAARALVNYGLENTDATLADCTKAISLGMEADFLYNMRGEIYLKNGDTSAALRDYTKAISLGIKDEDTFYNRGYIYQQSGQYKEALMDYCDAIGLNQDFYRAYANRAFCNMQLKRYDAAIYDYTICINHKEWLAFSYRGRGMCYAHKEDWQNAYTDLNQYLSLNPSDNAARNARDAIKEML